MRATREEIRDFLASTPNAQSSWIDILYTARLPMNAVTAFVQTMMVDVESPLRQAEDNALSKEIVKLSGVFGEAVDGGRGNGKTLVRVSAVVTLPEKLRVSSLVDNFCQVDIRQNGRYGRNGHIVCNVVRRCTAGYNYSRLPIGASVVEVGADVKSWLTDASERPWEVGKKGKYVSARPVISQRDVVRVKWEDLAKRILADVNGLYSERVKTRAGVMLDSYDGVFPNVKIQDLKTRGEYIISNDANYDIKFSDMPGVMVACGARAWYGTMLRVKGLTTSTRMSEGNLPLMGINYRVNWKAGRIDFRNPECNAFGYSHDVNELMKYEQRNGYVWSTAKAHYVYSKGPETNDELLFFTVVRVVKAIYMVQPNYVENPNAGMTLVKSIWAVGGWADGVPTRFEPVEYVVDTIAFGKIFEKRRAIDSKGDLSITLTLVKSTNVRMWLNGTPVGTNKKISTALMESVAVTIEAMVSQSRLRGNMIFERAMWEYQVCMEKNSWLYSLLESIIDLRAVAGAVTGPITNVWGSVRGTLADVALSSIKNMSVSIGVVPDHIRLADTGQSVGVKLDDEVIPDDDPLQAVYSDYAPDVYQRCKGLCVGSACDYCDSKADEWVGKSKPMETTESSTLHESSSETLGASDDSASDVHSQWSEPLVDVADERVGSLGWREESTLGMPERKSMEELIALEEYLKKAIITEVRIDATRIARAKCSSKDDVLRQCTSRTQHALVLFRKGKLIQTMGHDLPEFGAIYDHAGDKLIRTVVRNKIVSANVKDGWYYTCNHLKVWNCEEIIASVSHALDYGKVSSHGEKTKVTLGVFGAGKTYGMMKMIAKAHMETGVKFLVVSVTKKAATEAIAYGVKFGMNKSLLESRVKTVDSYLINGKFKADLVCVDEFTMAHMGRIDAVISLSEASVVKMCGDGRQIPYDPFTAEFEMLHATMTGRVSSESIEFLPETHRCREDVCAMWLDVYPSIYPCKCCRMQDKDKRSLFYERIGSIDDVKKEDGVRYHGYTRAEVDAIADGLRFGTDAAKMKLMKNGGVVSVHEDQGSTHDKVCTIRLRADYDKNSSARNPSLYNRPNYVLTDTSRHTTCYDYKSNSVEKDLIRRRIELSQDKVRLRLVRDHKGMGLTTVEDMLANRYHPKIKF